MSAKEATARIKINRLLEQVGWRFFDNAAGKANIQLEPNIKITKTALDAFGHNFETTNNGFVDFLLLDDRGFPLIVLEAKSEDKNPLVGKEQARRYAKSQNCRFVILSNGNLHYFWDLERGSPYQITTFPNPLSVKGYKTTQPNPAKLINEIVDDDYIVLTQRPQYLDEAGWKNESERPVFIQNNRLRFLRTYQKKAVLSLQQAVKAGQDRFLFEMATGTGKTLISAAVIKLFLRTGNVRRVLFLVDRLELEDQANKTFILLLQNDFKSVIYKENRADWRSAEIVVTTVQSLLHNNKYQTLFAPTDFDLVISDEAHRSIGGNARAVFEYFVGYKLGLTATPKDYLKKFDTRTPTSNEPREFERRLLLDTYRTFGCEDAQPTFRYSLLDGVKEGYLISPIVIDARTDITTQLLSEGGYIAEVTGNDDENTQQTYRQRQFEKNFFSEATNQVLCKKFVENALRDPISGEMGKSIIFAVSQNHAAKLTQILNQMADQMYPPNKDKRTYNSDFAVQVSSHITDAQQYAINFTNNNLLGSANFIDTYKTSKARICVTVGMMTTGYDCPDILNLGLFRPIFSPTDFIQIKGRGTRKHNFLEHLFDDDLKDTATNPEKIHYKLFDFFANCEYFEEEFNYDEVLTLPRPQGKAEGGGPIVPRTSYEYLGKDIIYSVREEAIDRDGMKIDRMFFDKFEDKVKDDSVIKEHIEKEQWDSVIDYINEEVMDKPEEFFNLDKLRKAAGVDRRLSLREILEKTFGMIDRFKSKDEMLNEEFNKFISDRKPGNHNDIMSMKYFFKAYVTDHSVRNVIESGNYTGFNTNSSFTMQDFKAVPEDWRKAIPEYVKDYVPLNQFMA